MSITTLCASPTPPVNSRVGIPEPTNPTVPRAPTVAWSAPRGETGIETVLKRVSGSDWLGGLPGNELDAISTENSIGVAPN
jgi:hypothetical protein